MWPRLQYGPWTSTWPSVATGVTLTQTTAAIGPQTQTALSSSPGLDNTRALDGSTGHPDQCGSSSSLCTPSWPQVVAQTLGILVTFIGNLGHGCPRSPWLRQDRRLRHGAWQQTRPWHRPRHAGLPHEPVPHRLHFFCSASSHSRRTVCFSLSCFSPHICS